jgi:hypothetical protein
MCLTTLERYIHAPLASNEYVLVTTWRYRLPLLLVLLRGVSTAFWSHPSLYNSLLVTILAIMTMHALLKLANTVLVFFGPEIKPSPRKQRTVQVD